MSRSKNERNDIPAPTVTELENLLSEIKPRPTSRLQQKLQFAPWHTEEEKFSMIRLRKLELVATGAALLLVAVIAAVFLLQWSPFNQSTLANGSESNQPTANAATSRQTENSAAPLPTRTSPTPTIPEGTLAWTNTLPGELNSSPPSASGIAYETNAAEGRVFVANGNQGVQLFSADGKHLGSISITDPETEQPVFVHDVAWTRLLWFGSAENEYGLFVLTQPFQSGEYLHIINPDNKTILQSFTLNNNIAIPVTTDLVSELPPTQLSASADGELYMDKVFIFAPETVGDPTTSLHYLLRSTIDGRILNTILVSQGPTNEERPSVIADLAYQTTTNSVYAAVRKGDNSIVQHFDLIGTPRLLTTVAETAIQWQEDVAIATDERGHAFILVDSRPRIFELDQNDQIINTYYFWFETDDSYTYPTASTTPFNYQLPGEIDQPLAMTVTPDGSTLFIVDQREGEIYLTAFILPEAAE